MKKFNKKLDIWNEYNHAGTWRGNQLSFMSSIYTMQYMKNKKICNSINLNSNLFTNSLNDLKNKYDIIRDIRYKGFMIAIEFINLPKLSSRKSGLYISSEMIAKKFQQNAFKNGLLLLRCGKFKNIIRIMPPLNTVGEEFEIIYDIISKSLEETINKID